MKTGALSILLILLSAISISITNCTQSPTQAGRIDTVVVRDTEYISTNGQYLFKWKFSGSQYLKDTLLYGSLSDTQKVFEVLSWQQPICDSNWAAETESHILPVGVLSEPILLRSYGTPPPSGHILCTSTKLLIYIHAFDYADIVADSSANNLTRYLHLIPVSHP